MNIPKDFRPTLEIPNTWLMEATSDVLFFDVLLFAHSTLESLLVDWIYFEHFSYGLQSDGFKMITNVTISRFSD